MKVDPYQCIIQQVVTTDYEPQTIADFIFESTESRMDDFDDIDDLHRPLDGMTIAEAAYCAEYENEITQNLSTITKQQHLVEIIEDAKRILANRV